MLMLVSVILILVHAVLRSMRVPSIKTIVMAKEPTPGLTAPSSPENFI